MPSPELSKASTQEARRRPRGEYARSAQTRERILAATLQVAGQVGLKDASVARIAEAGGVGLGNLYYHFPSRNKLLQTAAAWVFEQLLADLAAATKGVKGFFEREEASLRAYLEFVQRHPGYIRLAEERRFHFPEHYDAGVALLLGGIRDELAAGVKRGDLRPLDADEIDRLAHHLLGARYYADLMLQKHGESGAVDDRVVATYMNLIRGGLERASEPRR